jgi:hypothetical protein
MSRHIGRHAVTGLRRITDGSLPSMLGSCEARAMLADAHLHRLHINFAALHVQKGSQAGIMSCLPETFTGLRSRSESALGSRQY